MCGNPEFVDGFHTTLLVLALHERGGVPPSASIDHMKDDVLVDEEEVALDLCIEGVGNFQIARIAGPWTGPLSANAT
jgi:hypothetical protein